MTIAFLFLTYGNPHSIWKGWFEDFQECRIYIHNKNECTDPYFKQFCIKNVIDTAWGTWSLVDAHLNLLKEAMKISTTTHFALFSESCIPIKSYEYVINTISSKRNSCIQQFKNNKHSQWCVLTREDVTTILETQMKRCRCVIPDEFWIGYVLSKEAYEKGLTKVVWKSYISKTNGRSPNIINEIDDEALAENDFCFIRKVNENTIFKCRLNVAKWEELELYWGNRKCEGGLPRDETIQKTVSEIKDILQSRDQQKCIERSVTRIKDLEPLCDVPNLKNSATESMQLWRLFNKQMYIGNSLT